MRVVAALTAVLIGLVLSGCTSDSDDSPDELPSADLTTQLTVVVDDGDAKQEFDVTCDPAGGSHPRPESACEFLELAAESGADPFEMVPADAVCSSIYGGPETATVEGEWRGQPVDAIFSRDNGCEIARWDNAVALLAFQGEDATLGGIQP